MGKSGTWGTDQCVFLSLLVGLTGEKPLVEFGIPRLLKMHWRRLPIASSFVCNSYPEPDLI